jgi:DNA sulfur modification protein DndB
MAATTQILSTPATRGHMGKTEYFTANFRLGLIDKLFTYDPEDMAELPIEQRTQRALKKGRVPEIADYILNNDDYIFSSITVSVDAEELEFVPSEIDPNVGILKLPMEANWIVNDGQHRVAGIVEAIRHSPSLRSDTISVVILPDEGLERSQQIFSDLNRTVVKTSKSIDILFDHRSPINRITNTVVERVSLFAGKTDKERVSLSVRSAAFATLSSVQVATAGLFAHVDEKDLESNYDTHESLAVEFWEHVTTMVEPWAEIASGVTKPSEARGTYLSSYAILIAAIGAVGGSAISSDSDWKELLAPLKDIDFRKDNDEWQGYCMAGNEVVTRVSTRKSMAELLRWMVGLRDAKPEGTLA